MANIAPVHLMKWIEEHKTLFSGPVANKEVFPESEFIYQIVRGPNARNDFHIDPGDEIFHQLKGDITVRCIDTDGKPRDITVREGRLGRFVHGNQRASSSSSASTLISPPAYVATKPTISWLGKGQFWLPTYRMSFTSTPTSSFTSRATQPSSDSPLSTKPATSA